MKKLFTYFFILFIGSAYAQKLNFTDTKLKKLLLTSSSSNKIAIDANGQAIAIDANKDGEIDSEEANRVRILTIRQDENSSSDPHYYQAHLPDNISDVLLFNNLEELYVYDTKSIKLHFKDNDKLTTFKIEKDIELGSDVTFENCKGITNIENIKAGRYESNYDEKVYKLSLLNNPNISGSAHIKSNLNELVIKQVPIDSLKMSSYTYENMKLTVTEVPTLKSIVWDESHIFSKRSKTNYIDINISKNINLEEIIVNGGTYGNNPITINNLNVTGSTNLKKIKGLNTPRIDFSNDGLVNLEELDIAFYNKYGLYSISPLETYDGEELRYSPGVVTSVNLSGLPNLKTFIGSNQKFETINFEGNQKITSIELINSYVKELKLNNLSELEYLDSYSSKQLKDIEIVNTPKLSKMRVNNPYLEALTIKGTGIASLELGDVDKNGSSPLTDYKLKKLELEDNKNLTSLNMAGIELSELDLARTPNLDSLSIREVPLKTLNLKNNKFLKVVDFYLYNPDKIVFNDEIVDIKIRESKIPFIDLEFKNKLTSLYIIYSEFEGIKFGGNKELENIDLNGVLGFNSLDLSDLNNLKNLTILNGGEIEKLVLKNNKNLKDLWLRNIGISNLDLTEAPKLKALTFEYSKKMETLDLSKNANLEYFQSAGLGLKHIDLSNQSKLENVSTDIGKLNIRNGFIEKNLDLNHDESLDVCVDDQQLESVKRRYPNARVHTDCNLSTSKIEMLNADAIGVYPNPIIDIVEIKSPEDILLVEIASTSGERVFLKEFNSKNLKANLSHLRSGVYVLKIKTAKGIVTKKLIKK